MLTLSNTDVTTNLATDGGGGSGGKSGSRRAPDGASGRGIGGGLSIDPLSWVGLDAFTAKHVKSNKASTMDANVHGTYDVIS
jgi:hypothetical protein